jgi:hypothetical protein
MALMPLSSVAVATAPSPQVVSGFGLFVIDYVFSVCSDRIFAICPLVCDFHQLLDVLWLGTTQFLLEFVMPHPLPEGIDCDLL